MNFISSVLFNKEAFAVSKIVLVTALLIGATIRLSGLLTEVKLIGDSASRYDPIARNIAEGNGFSKASAPPYVPDTFEQPAYPYFVATIYYLTAGSKRAVIFVQLVLEMGILLLVLAICRSMGLSERCQFIVLSTALLCPFLPVFSGKILTEILATFTITVTCYCLLRAVTLVRFRWWFCAGVAGGLGILTRLELFVALALMLFAAAFFLILKRQWKQVVCGSFFFLLTIAIVLLPWTVRNYRVFGTARPWGAITEQVGLGYTQWLNTWIDDPKYLDPYWWHVLDQNATPSFPMDKMPEEEREKAETALLLAIKQQTFEGQPGQLFFELANDAKRKRPLQVYLFVPARRALMSLLRVPTYIESRSLKIISYFFWMMLLFASALGAILSAKRKRAIIVLPLALILGRLILPVLTSMICESRHMIEALPMYFLFVGLAFEIGRYEIKTT